MTNPGQLTHGIPSRDPIKQLATDLAAVRRELLALKAQTNTVTQYVTSDDNSAAFTGSWATFGTVGPFIVPQNCTNVTVFLWAAAGVTWGSGGGGNIGVQVLTGTSLGSLVGTGPAISVGGAASTATSVTTVAAGSASGFTPGTNWYVGVSAYAAGTYTGSGNTHLNGVLIWTRS